MRDKKNGLSFQKKQHFTNILNEIIVIPSDMRICNSVIEGHRHARKKKIRVVPTGVAL